jgi:V8-like Glu-specific endopeptidase
VPQASARSPVPLQHSSAATVGYWTQARLDKARPVGTPRAAPGRALHAAYGGRELPYHPISNGYMSALGPVGRLFLTSSEGDGWCSATLIGSNLIATAAHCVYDAQAKEWTWNWWFTPGTDTNTPAPGPWGGFNGNDGWIQNKWPTWRSVPGSWGQGYWPFDYAFVTLDPSEADGANAGDAAGFYRLSTGEATSGDAGKRRVLAVGYPGDGQWGAACDEIFCDPWYCDSQIQKYSRYRHGFYDQGISCRTSGGMSGGPWLKLENGQVYVTSVTSHFGINHAWYPPHVYGRSLFAPYFDQNTDALWRAAGGQ